MKEVGLGFIGAGFMGEGHVHFARQLPYAKLVGVADIDLSRAKEVASKYRIPNAYADYHELLENKDIEAVVIATPEFAHTEVAVDAAKVGKHILLEKPIARNLKDAKTIMDACRKSGVKLMIGYVYRHYPQMKGLRGFVGEGLLGHPLTAVVRIDGDITEAARMSKSSTVEMYIGVHNIDLMLWYIQDEVATVYAEASDGEVMKRFGLHDSMCMLLKFKKGTVGYVQCGWGEPTNWAGWKKPAAWTMYYGNMTPHNVQLVGTKGVAEVRLPPEGLFAADEESVGIKLPSVVAASAYKEQMEYFLRCLREDIAPAPSGEDGYRSLEIALAAAKSCDEKKPVKLPL